MIDKTCERLGLTKEEYELNLKKFVSADGKLKNWPSKDKARIAVLIYAQTLFEANKTYTEMEVNWIIRKFYSEDHVLIRRSLIDYKLLIRTSDGKNYTLSD